MEKSFSAGVTLPVFSSQNFCDYKKDLELWSMISSVPKEKQALAVAYSLPQEVKKAVLDELSIKEDLSTASGLNTLIRHLEKRLEKHALVRLYNNYVEGWGVGQKELESIEDYIKRFEDNRSRCSEDSRAAFELLSGAKMPQKEKEKLLESFDADQALIYSRVANLLRNIKGDAVVDQGKSSRKRKRHSSQAATVKAEEGCTSSEELSLLDLPNELLKKVIFLLETKDIVSLSGVCKRLYQHIADCRPWRELSPSVYSLKRLPSLLSHISKCSRLKRLNLPGGSFNDFNALYAQVAASCSKLESLSLTVFDRHDLDYLAFLFESCTEIKKLSMKSSEMVLIDLRALKMIGNRLPHLTELDISDNFMDPTELTYISQKFRSLRLLVLQVYGNSDDESNVAIKQISERCTDLEVLKLKGFSINSASLMSIGTNCRKLRTFLLYPDRDMTSADLKEFGRLCPRLVNLHLMVGDMDNPTFSVGTSDMLENLTDLQSFHLYEERRSTFPIQIMDTLSDRCPSLKDVSLFLHSDGNQISGALRSFLIQPSVGSQLEKISIRYNIETPVRALKELGRHSPNLKHLHLGKVTISELDFLYILRGCRKLESIILADLDSCTITWTCDIGKFCPNLRSISSNCLNGVSARSILSNCSLLQRVDVSGENLQTESLGDLNNLQHLEILRVCPVETVSGFVPLVVNCRRLRQIYSDFDEHDKRILRNGLNRPVQLLSREDLVASNHPWILDQLLAYGTSFGPFALPP